MIRKAMATYRWHLLLLAVPVILAFALIRESPIAASRAIDAIESHRTYVLDAILILIAQTGMIVLLLVNQSRRRSTEARHSAILRALPDLMFLQSRDGVFLDYSAKDPSILLVPPAQFIGKNMSDILPPPLAAMFVEKVACLFDGQEPMIFEYEVPVPAGEIRFFEARLVRCENDKFLSIVRDITERKRAADALASAQAELMRAMKLATLGEFAGSIAHELAQPLTAIMANSHACLRLLDQPDVDLAEVREGVRDVLGSGKIAREVINHTRHLFSSEPLERTSLDLPDVVNEVAVMVRTTLDARRIAMETRFDANLPAVHGDRVQLRQVILNLISNGIQAMEHVDAEQPRRLTISAERQDRDAVRLTVSDTGIGLANVDRSRLFTISYTTKPDGMGWGLSISRSIVEAHGGRLWVDANEAAGASFSFTLPISAGQREPLADGAVLA